LAEALDAEPDARALLRDWLAARAARAPRPDGLVSAAVQRLDADSDRVGSVAFELGVSERALRRRVTTAVGYGPKRLGRVFRLWRALAAARAGEDLGRVAFDAGYADQAHFTGDCRALAGVPPTVLLTER
jgi:methylphosphotriester-DNA--protein-cysteine methyltransferase